MLKTITASTKNYPHKSLLEVNADVHTQVYSVIESFKDENLAFRIDHYDRTIGDILSHALMTQRHFFLGFLVMGNEEESDYKEPKLSNIDEALDMIQKNYDITTKLIQGLSDEDLNVVIKTEWGQEMSKELAAWQGISQIMQHVGEITVIAGIGGFYEGVLG
ncbi:MAG: DinB family protein [Candidatus Dojkabacteria bacterium]